MNQILSMEKFSVPHVGLISCDLRHPVAVRIMGYAATPDFPCEYIFKEEQMKALQQTCYWTHLPIKFLIGGGYLYVDVYSGF